MTLTLNNIHHFLMASNIVTAHEFMSGDYEVSLLPNRNIIFKVKTESKALFVKQITDFNHDGLYRLQKDATCLSLIESTKAYTGLRPFTARFYDFNHSKNALVTAFFDDSQDLITYYTQFGEIPKQFYSEVVTILTMLHFDVSHLVEGNKYFQFFKKEKPWIYDYVGGTIASHDPIDHGQLNAIKAITNDIELLTAIKDAWTYWNPISLIHGDIKLTNLIVTGAAAKQSIKLIDWDRGDIGDPLWDVAGLFHSIVCTRLLINEKQLLAGILKYNLDLELRLLWPLLRDLWLEYFNQNRDKAFISDQSLSTCLRYTAIRLVQTAVEMNVGGNALLPNAEKVVAASKYIFDHLPRIRGYFTKD